MLVASDARMAKLEASTAEIKAGQEASTAKLEASIDQLRAGQDAIISQLNANKQDTDRKLDALDSAYVQLNQELQEVKSHVTLLENPPVEATQKVVDAVYAIVKPALQLDLNELVNQGRRTLEERFEQFQTGFVTVEVFEKRCEEFRKEMDNRFETLRAERFSAQKAEVERFTRELSSRGNAFDARAPNLRVRKESLLSTISPTNRGPMRPWDVWCSGGETNNSNNNNSKDTDHPINLSSTYPWDVWCRGKHSNSKTNYQV